MCLCLQYIGVYKITKWEANMTEKQMSTSNYFLFSCNDMSGGRVLVVTAKLYGLPCKGDVNVSKSALYVCCAYVAVFESM